MPLDLFQKRVAKIIAPNRTINSPLAGGSMIQRHAFRLSDDADIFVKDEDVNALFNADRRLLETAGLNVDETKRYPGFVEALVSSVEPGAEARTSLQWVSEGLNGFFPAILDDEVGFRLHMADLAVNKILACAGRKELRDFVDLWMIDQFAMPLWRLALAAPGKDVRWSPQSLVEKVVSNMAFSRWDFENDVTMTIELSPSTIMQNLMSSIEEARSVLASMQTSNFGRLAIKDRNVVNDRGHVEDVDWIDVYPGGDPARSGFSDDNLVRPIIEKFGIDGSGITDSLTFP